MMLVFISYLIIMQFFFVTATINNSVWEKDFRHAYRKHKCETTIAMIEIIQVWTKTRVKNHDACLYTLFNHIKILESLQQQMIASERKIFNFLAEIISVKLLTEII